MPLLISIAVTMILSAFFSGMEIAFVSSNRMLAEMDREGNHLTKKLISNFYKHPNEFRQHNACRQQHCACRIWYSYRQAF